MKTSTQNSQTATSTQTTSINKNPLTLKTFEERGKAINDKLERIKSNPAYQKLSEHDQKRVLNGMYDKYVKPAYAGAKFPIPDHVTWIGGAQHVKGSSTYESAGIKAFGEDLAVGGIKALDNIGMFGVKVNRAVFMAMHGLDEHFAKPILNQFGWSPDTKAKYSAEVVNDKREQRYVQNIQNADYFLQTHPRTGTINKLASDAGEFIATLPIYEAVGSLTGVAKGLAFTDKLMQSPVGRFAAKRIAEGTDGFLSTLVTSGGNPDEAVKGAAGFAVLGAGMEGTGKIIKTASAPLIKKWTANTIAMGGIPFAAEVMNSVVNEEEATSLAIKKYNKNQPLELHNGITIHPETETTGKFTFKDPYDNGAIKEFPYSNASDRQQIYFNLNDLTQTIRAKADPLMDKLHKGERAALNSFAIQEFNKPLSDLSEKEWDHVLSQRVQSIQQAAEEAPVHLPELTKAEHENSWSSQVKSNPILAQNAKMLEQFGIKISDVTADNEIEQTAIDTGIKDSIATQSKVGKSRNAAISSIQKRMEKGISLRAEEFNNHVKDSISYLRNPKLRVKLASTIGERAKDNFRDFIDILKEADGNKIHFENPYHRLLFHYGNRDKLPQEVSKKIAYEIRKIEPKKSLAAIQKEADWFHIHLLQMARSGRLISEGNIFNSTKTKGAGMLNWTPWQKELTSEVDEAQYKILKKQLTRHPEVMKAMDEFIKVQQNIRLVTDNPEDWIKADKMLHDTMNKVGIMGKLGQIIF